MGIKKRMISGIVSASVLFGAAGLGVSENGANIFNYDISEAAASSFTSEQGAAWAQARVNEGWCKDVDNAFGCQCVDLILAYYDYLGVARVGGNACDYITNKLPSGWTRVSTPKPGDIFVQGPGVGGADKTYGHIGIVVGVDGNNVKTAETNYWVAHYKNANARNVTRDISKFTTFIRPNFSNSQVTVNVTFHRNLSGTDSEAVVEPFTKGVANQKFGYKADGTARYNFMNDPSVGFGQWKRDGYKLLGWSFDKNATTAQYQTYSAVVDSWIVSYSPKADLYAVWTPEVSVTFYRNAGETDDASVTEVFTKGVANQKFGYKADGTARYDVMNEPEAGFGEWKRDGYKLLGWSFDKDATIAQYKTYSAVIDDWIVSNTPKASLYAVWEAEESTGPFYGDTNLDGKVDVTDLTVLSIALVDRRELTGTAGENADVDGNGKVELGDLATLKQYLSKVISKLGPKVK